jgi:hypothetical protein
LENPLLRPANAKLAATRFTSYSNGSGSVSSKSFTSNSRTRSGEADSPEFDSCASPRNWASGPATGVSARSAAMILGLAIVGARMRDPSYCHPAHLPF